MKIYPYLQIASVQKSLKVLKKQGIIVSRRSKGYFVIDKYGYAKEQYARISLVTIVADSFKSAGTTAKWEMELSDTAKVMSKGQVTIPKRIRDLLNLKNGDYVTFVVNKDEVQIQNSKVFIEENIRK